MHFNILELLCACIVAFGCGFLFCAWLNGALFNVTCDAKQGMKLPPLLHEITPEQGQHMLVVTGPSFGAKSQKGTK